MKTERCLLALIFAMVLPGTVLAQAGRRAAPPPKTADKCLLKENVNEDIAAQVNKFKLVSMPFSVSGLTDNERKMVYKLVEASQFLESIYWRQSDPKGLGAVQAPAGLQPGNEPEDPPFPDDQRQPL